MPTYVIGDVQGCYDELTELLERVEFDPTGDRLWLVGDLVNRGPRSLDVLRFVKSLEHRAVTVLGNHDLHLLAVSVGARPLKGKDTFQDVLEAPDHEAVLRWLRHRPVLHWDREENAILVHAGVPCGWSAEDAVARARELESVLQGEDYGEFLSHMYGNAPDRWSPSLTGWERLRFITNAFTRMRFVDNRGHVDVTFSGPPGTQGDGLVPWFEAHPPRPSTPLIVFGHWATLSLDPSHAARYRVRHVDTGCVWGGRLSALRLDDDRMFSVPSRQG